MYIFEIFLKRRRYLAVFEKAWQLVSSRIAYPPGTGEEPEQKLVYFGVLSYATVFQSALAAGMSSSAGHYLARMQIRKYQFDSAIAEAVNAVFSPSEDGDQDYAGLFQARIGAVVQAVAAGGDAAAEAAIEPAMLELSRAYRRVAFHPA